MAGRQYKIYKSFLKLISRIKEGEYIDDCGRFGMSVTRQKEKEISVYNGVVSRKYLEDNNVFLMIL